MIKMSSGQNQLSGAESGPGERKSLYWVWWLVGVLVEVAVLLPGAMKMLDRRALLLTLLIFVPLVFSLEHIGIYFGWWVWNEDRIIGWKIWLVPVEEFLLYFLVVPSVLVIQVQVLKLIRYCRSKRGK